MMGIKHGLHPPEADSLGEGREVNTVIHSIVQV